MPVDAEDLADIPLFDTLSRPDREALAGSFEEKAVSEGTRLLGEGAAGYSFFVLAEGEAEVSVDGVAIATLGAGDYFGEMAILGDGRRVATVTATSPVKVFVMFGTEFRSLQAAHPEVADQIQALVRERSAML
ncbi:MAG TPA: cyclic nucleotide-binding domain-containing protein [Gaiellaceae bacterium]|nr:cyclic nucleotide-binding domain-containing protein [Gaiellaceae bacterium]